jgi:hypothetical protein
VSRPWLLGKHVGLESGCGLKHAVTWAASSRSAQPSLANCQDHASSLSPDVHHLVPRGYWPLRAGWLAAMNTATGTCTHTRVIEQLAVVQLSTCLWLLFALPPFHLLASATPAGVCTGQPPQYTHQHILHLSTCIVITPGHYPLAWCVQHLLPAACHESTAQVLSCANIACLGKQHLKCGKI